MQKSQLLGKYYAGSNCGHKITSSVIHNNPSDYLVESTVFIAKCYKLHYINKIMLVFLISKRRGFDPPKLPLPGCATGTVHWISLAQHANFAEGF